MKVSNKYHKYFRDLSKYSDALDSDMATTTHRIGLTKIRDLFTIVRNYYSEGNSYTGMVRDFFSIFVLMVLLSAQWNIPSHVAVFLAVGYVSVNMAFGYVSYKYLNLLLTPTFFLPLCLLVLPSSQSLKKSRIKSLFFLDISVSFLKVPMAVS